MTVFDGCLMPTFDTKVLQKQYHRQFSLSTVKTLILFELNIFFIPVTYDLQTVELSAYCISGKLSAAILGKPSGKTFLSRFGKILMCNNIICIKEQVIIAFKTLQFRFLNILHGLIYLIWVNKNGKDSV